MLKDFLGAWKLDRVIDDARAGQRMVLSGNAVFSPNASGLRCEETGMLNVPEQPPMEARQTTFWQPCDAGIAVFFADGRPFHEFPLERVADVHHDCPPDDYRGRYDFTVWPRWTLSWRVRGPRKDYAMLSTYQRLGPRKAGHDMG